PVEFTATPENLALVGDKPAEVKLHLAGPKSDLDSLDQGHVTVKISLDNVLPGNQTVVVSEENVELPRNVKLLEADPPSFVISLKELTEKEAPIKPQLVGKLAENLKLAGVEVHPKTVRVLAPVGEAKKDGQLVVMTTPIYLESITENTLIFCKVIAPPNLQPVDKRWPDVEVVVKVRSK
ncbi:MAG: CdaR family protein, partial [Thermodesulfobacteriota bacterium]